VLYEALRTLEHRARSERRRAGLPRSRREAAREAQRRYGVAVEGRRLSDWLPDEPGAAQVPRDSDQVWAIVRLWSDWAGDSAPDRRYWSDLVEAAQPHRAPSAATQAAPGRPLGDFTDPFALEVHRAIDVDVVGSDRHAGDLPPLPGYVSRDHDVQLGRVVDRAAGGLSTIVVLVGGSSTGKTRACWEAVQRLPDDWRLWHPIDPSPPESVLRDLAAVAPRTVVWLNETQHYLLTRPPELGEQVAAGLRELLRDPGRAPVLVVGTIWPEYWGRLTGGVAVAGPEGLPQARALLTGTSIDVPETFTGSDMEVLRTATDPRLIQAGRYAEDGQVTQYLAGVPVLLERYRNAPAPAKALIHAAMDARRLRHRHLLPRELLTAAAPGYLTDRQWDALDDDWIDDALAYTAAPCRGVRGPLTPIRVRPGRPRPEQPRYRLADYLDQVGHRERRTCSMPATLWDAFLGLYSEGIDLVWLGDQAKNRGLYRYAFRFYSAAAEAHEPFALAGMAMLFRSMGRIEEAITWFQARVDAGESASISWLAHLLLETARTEEAMALYRRSADAGDAIAMETLAGRLRKMGRTDEAIALYQRAVETAGTDGYTSDSALENAVRLLTEAGRVEELIGWLRVRAEAGNASAGTQGARILEKTERREEAIAFYQLAAMAHGLDGAAGAMALNHAAELMAKAGRTSAAIATFQKVADLPGDDEASAWTKGDAMARAVLLMRNAGHAGEAIGWLKRRVAAGATKGWDSHYVATLLREGGQTEAAVTWLEGRARAGHHEAIGPLVDLLAETDRVEEAIGWLAKGADVRDYYLGRLTRMLEEADRIDEAITICRRLAEGGNTRARQSAAELLRKAGRPAEAIAILPIAGTRGTDDRTALLRDLRVELLCQAGRRDEAITWLKERAAAGDRAAADKVTDLLVREGRGVEAIAWLRHRTSAGDADAAKKAATMLREAGRIDEMITWLTEEARPGWGALMEAADTLREMGRTAAAITFYQRAADAAGIGSTWLQAATRVIELFRRQDRVDQAIGWLKAQAAAGEHEALQEVASLLAQAGRIDEALVFWGRAIESAGWGFLGGLPPHIANWLRDRGYAEYVERIQRYGIEPGGSPADPWEIKPTRPHPRT
jgi:tetratricopeptide (TPR) repeat protein